LQIILDAIAEPLGVSPSKPDTFGPSEDAARVLEQAMTQFHSRFPYAEIENRYLSAAAREASGKDLSRLLFVTRDASGTLVVFWHRQAVDRIISYANGPHLKTAFLAVLVHEYLRGERWSHDEVEAIGLGEKDLENLSWMTAEEFWSFHSDLIVSFGDEALPTAQKSRPNRRKIIIAA
jgi:hypothetical protein